MSKSALIEVNIAQADGLVLDWLIARTEGVNVWLENGRLFYTAPDAFPDIWEPSTDWNLCGPLIRKYRISLLCPPSVGDWWGAFQDGNSHNAFAEAETETVAICRSVAMGKYGEIPKFPASTFLPLRAAA